MEVLEGEEPLTQHEPVNPLAPWANLSQQQINKFVAILHCLMWTDVPSSSYSRACASLSTSD